MEIRELKLPDCFEIRPTVFNDGRGSFVKTFHREIFAEHGLAVDFAEEYYSVSHSRVLRGLHFQTPPFEHAKLIYCVLGRVLDAVVDLRVGSPTYGRYTTLEMNADQANMVYIPDGMAHGFYVLSKEAILVYNVTSTHSPECDTGIHWNSVGIPWPDDQPIVSARDSNFEYLATFRSPFRYRAGA